MESNKITLEEAFKAFIRCYMIRDNVEDRILLEEYATGLGLTDKRIEQIKSFQFFETKRPSSWFMPGRYKEPK
jgi:hypothetical protein